MKAAALFLLLAPLLLVLGSFYAVAAGDNNNDGEHGRCTGSVLECGIEMADHEELEKEYSSTNTRFLAAQIKYITPDVLRADQPACGKVTRGDPYRKSCLPSPSNPENRGCSSYYRCRR
ncbi:hypothetical protein I3843_01G106200 [Carya illinoinensis]|uniref:Protein RALF-like 33 n=1 Tax=Carya illinoinensis TaxID=32201 RepID=A0A8T1RLU2_CARIL|nr:protein RALF-like 32 [Carya illinoinensis]KAG2726401.1 hypothetical protein I3760_01G110700 [Carya illinoinensis]KAG6667649.1 hypothetical protein CIPAW_01G115500 [Carya illinoinensis]KAG6731105.1 hypothetical protein I3842_01G113200 [Carya illinoinensis]KAG7995384.1 hypothetical protein I3843_01G106200 [Carya illinoinensis]